jgi:4-hydroxy-tetrahydrodipicolinate reductase
MSSSQPSDLSSLAAEPGSLSAVRVGVIGAAGRMGKEVCRAVVQSPDLILGTALDIDDPLANLRGAGVSVAVDFTTPEAVMGHIEFCLASGIHMVIGTTGFGEERLAQVRSMLDRHPEVGVIIAPNFSLGAVLLMRYARQAAAYFESVEIIEMHHPDKLDAPSGTAQHTARMIAQAREEARMGPPPDATVDAAHGARGALIDGVTVHSVRARGLVAHEEVLFGNPGEVFTLRHDSLDRSSFMPGVLLAVRSVESTPGLTLGLEPLLGH